MAGSSVSPKDIGHECQSSQEYSLARQKLRSRICSASGMSSLSGTASLGMS